MNQQHTFGLEIYASNRQFYVGRGESITFPVEDGQMQVLPHHEDMIAAIVPGEMDFVERAEEQLRQKKSLEEYNANQMALARAMSRLRVTSRKRI